MNDENKQKPINVDEIDLERMKDMTSDNKAKNEFAVERGGVFFAPTQEGAIKSRAFKVMDEQINMQMSNIVEQIEVLARQAEDLKLRRVISEIIYRAKMNFEPLVGDTYYLYLNDKGPSLSILSPQDLGESKMISKNINFQAKVKLLADCTWEVLEKSDDFII
jgi:predicted transcriptional regulator